MTYEEMIARYPYFEKFKQNSAEASLRLQVINVAADVEKAAAYDRGERYNDVDDEEVDDEEVDGEDVEVDDDENGLAAYFADSYDVTFTVALGGNGLCYEGVKIAVAVGGPAIIVDTERREVRGLWWSDRFETPLDAQACNQIDEIFEEVFEANR